MKNIGFQMSIFLEKYSMIFQNSLIKSLINKIKNIKISRICWQVQKDEIENKISKIIKKIKNQTVNRRILKKKIFQISIFLLKELLEFSRNRW